MIAAPVPPPLLVAPLPDDATIYGMTATGGVAVLPGCPTLRITRGGVTPVTSPSGPACSGGRSPYAAAPAGGATAILTATPVDERHSDALDLLSDPGAGEEVAIASWPSDPGPPQSPDEVEQGYAFTWTMGPLPAPGGRAWIAVARTSCAVTWSDPITSEERCAPPRVALRAVGAGGLGAAVALPPGARLAGTTPAGGPLVAVGRTLQVRDASGRVLRRLRTAGVARSAVLAAGGAVVAEGAPGRVAAAVRLHRPGHPARSLVTCASGDATLLGAARGVVAVGCSPAQTVRLSASASSSRRAGASASCRSPASTSARPRSRGTASSLPARGVSTRAWSACRGRPCARCSPADRGGARRNRGGAAGASRGRVAA